MAFTRSIGLSMILAGMFEVGGFVTRISLRNEKKDRSRPWWDGAVEDGRAAESGSKTETRAT